MLTSLVSLWLPIVLSGVALFFASWLAWMVMPHHKSEWKGLADEDAVLRAIKNANIQPGQYCFPYAATPEAMKDGEFKTKMQAGPRGTLTLWATPPSMGMKMLCTLAFFVIANFVIAYLAGMVLPQGTGFEKVFRFVATAGILTYGTANILNGIWFGRKMVADIIDGIAYGLITGAIFAWLWPGT